MSQEVLKVLVDLCNDAVRAIKLVLIPSRKKEFMNLKLGTISVHYMV